MTFGWLAVAAYVAVAGFSRWRTEAWIERWTRVEPGHAQAACVALAFLLLGAGCWAAERADARRVGPAVRRSSRES